MRPAFLFAASLCLAACVSSPVRSIGTATMAADRTITLDLRNDADGNPVHARRDYRLDDPNYGVVLKHLGGLAPGQTKQVAPWPK